MSLGACLGPMQEMRMNFKHQGTVDYRQNIEILCFKILVNPKLVWNSWNLACYHGEASACCGNFVSHLGQVWEYASHKPELLTTSIMVSVGNAPPLGKKRYPLLLIALKNFSCQHRTTGVLCQFLGFLGFVWTFLCINWVFNAFMCIIQIWTTCTCSNAYKLVENPNLCPWLHA